MKLAISIAILISVCAVLHFAEGASADSGAEYTIARTSAPPRIDGKLDDPVWTVVEPAELALTDQGVEATKKSLAYGVYDDDFLYFGFHRIDDDLGKLKLDAQNRDGNVWEDDEFELFLDANHDHATYWQICLNGDNVIWDCYNPGAGCNGGNDTDWETATDIDNDEDWFAEIKVSFKALDTKTPKAGDVWGVNFCGHVLTGLDEWVTWSDIGPSFHTPTGFGNMTFSGEVLAVGSAGKLSTLWGRMKTSN